MKQHNQTASRIEWQPMPAGTLLRFAFQRKLRQSVILAGQVGIIVLAVIAVIGIRMSTMSHGFSIPSDTTYGGMTCTQVRQVAASVTQQPDDVQQSVAEHMQKCSNCKAAMQSCH